MTVINAGLEGYEITQNPNQGSSQMMSYIITTPDKHLIVIDGGMAEDAGYLREKILAHGGTVHVWLITHAHMDHIDALTEILKDPGNIKIKQIYMDFPPRDWLARTEPQYFPNADAFLAAVGPYADLCRRVERGMCFEIGGIQIEVLSDARQYQNMQQYNDTSVAYKFTFPTSGKTALFLGDMGECQGEFLLEEYGAAAGEKLHSLIVQMAHHGQNGASRQVYELIAPQICLWPTPKWLWDNDIGGGTGSGPWKTLQVREWMKELGAKTHGNMVDGEVRII